MSEDRVVELRHPGSFSEDPLTSVLRSGAQRLLAQAVEMEVTAFIVAHGDLKDEAGRRRVVRHGHHRERQVQTGIGPVAVRCPRVRVSGGAGGAGEIRFIATPERTETIRRLVTAPAAAVAGMFELSAEKNVAAYGHGPPLHDPCVIARLLAPDPFEGRVTQGLNPPQLTAGSSLQAYPRAAS